LIHNPSAGDDSKATGEQLVRWIREAGHKVEYYSSKEKKWRKELKKHFDVIAIAGGDGTVGNVARRLIGNRTPIAVLPMGTANNIAKTLEVTERPVPDLIKGWSSARCVDFDAAVAIGPWDSAPFIEGFGVGLFAETMLQLNENDNRELAGADNPEGVLNSVLTILKKKVPEYQPKKMVVQLDGQDLSGEYVVLEALNIRHVGPNLNLAPKADISDGFLDVVFVSKQEREKLARHFAALIRRKNARSDLRVRRGKHLHMEWENSPVHIDDTPWPAEGEKIPVRSNSVDIRVQPAALVFLLPSIRRRAR
jgi:diacylglycerol kinase (ATP)